MLLANTDPVTASTTQLVGAGAFGVIIGWYVYYINRYRKAEVQLTDIVALVGAIGGGAVLALFDKKTDLFGTYGIGLFVGFFGYFLILLLLVGWSMATTQNFNWEWFLDGRRKDPISPWGYPPDGTGGGGRPMNPGGADNPGPPGVPR